MLNPSQYKMLAGFILTMSTWYIGIILVPKTQNTILSIALVTAIALLCLAGMVMIVNNTYILLRGVGDEKHIKLMTIGFMFLYAYMIIRLIVII